MSENFVFKLKQLMNDKNIEAYFVNHLDAFVYLALAHCLIYINKTKNRSNIITFVLIFKCSW